MTHRQISIGLGAASLAALFGFALVPEARAHDEEAMFQKMDTNGDGKLSPEEHAAGAKKMFEKIDANGDGKVTVAEMDAFHDKMDKKDKAKAVHNEKAERTAMSSAEKIKVIDTNNDGVLTEDEHVAGSKKMFEKMDTNGDGFLDRAEMKTGHEKLMSKGAFTK